MGTLPRLSNTNQLLSTYQVQFGGLNHTKGAADGDIYDMKNMTSDHYPVLCPREKRKELAELEDTAGGMISYNNVIVIADGTQLKMIKDGVVSEAGTITAGEKIFAPFQNKVIVFPDKIALNTDDGTTENLSTTLELSSAVFKVEGMLYGAEAENNTIYSAGAHFENYFKAGDAVEISGCNIEANNKTPIIREVETDYLRFYENVFQMKIEAYTYTATKKMPATATGQYSVTPCYGFVSDGYRVAFYLTQDAEIGTLIEWKPQVGGVLVYFADESGVPAETPTSIEVTADDITKYLAFIGREGDVTETNITLSRTLPDMDFLITDDNRLWGAKGHTVYASKLGDPTNFNVFDGLSTDSYSVDIGNAGDITAAINYGGYPTFFKEDGIYRLYGDQPSNYQIMPTMKQGVRKGCAKSLAVAGEILYYVSRSGIMAYGGGAPEKADTALGIHVIDGVAASDERKYYISATEDGSNYAIYVYDTEKGLWHKEDDLKLNCAVFDGRLLGLSDDGKLFVIKGEATEGTTESAFEWSVEFADMMFGSPFQKGIVKANIRFDLAEGAEACADIQYDDSGTWELMRKFNGTGKGTNVLPVVPHRCDHFRLRLRGIGVCDIYAMTLQYYSGSEINLRG